MEKLSLRMVGAGLIRGLVETARNFTGSYCDPARLTTVQYPEESLPPVESARTFPFLVFDGDSQSGLRCVACKICEKECPPQCIYIVSERDEKGKVLKRPKVFDIDISVCMGCQICVEVCPFDAIRMDVKFELSVFDRFKPLLLHKEDLAKSNEYYHSIHPLEARETDLRLAAARAKQQSKTEGTKSSSSASSTTKAP